MHSTDRLYSPTVRVSGWIVCSGQTGNADGVLVTGGVEAELRQAIHNLERVLRESGATIRDIVKITLYLTDMADYAAVNTTYCELLGDHRPARTAIAVAGLPRNASIEIEAWAHVGSDRRFAR